MDAPRTCRRCGATIPPGAAACPRCLLGSALEPPPTDPDAIVPPTGAPRARPVPPDPGELVGLFPDLDIIGLIGHGGMGAVYRARQKRLERDVALKVLPRELSADRAFAERFLREARALARLSHPSIVAVHDYGETGGLCWLLLEYVEGANLREVLRAGLMEPRQALSVVRDLCDALQYAHDEGVVHRDIKPENVLVDRRGRAKVADFGLAKLIGPAREADLTREGQVMGTPHYMAPEQIERPREVDHRADIYALGVVLYEMLTGSLPRGNFEPPSRRVRVDVKLDSIVLKALEHEPARRYQHAVDVRTDVDQVGAGTDAGRASPGRDVGSVFVEVVSGREHGVGEDAPRSRTWRAPFQPRVGLFLLGWIVLIAGWNLGVLASWLALAAFLALAALVVRRGLRWRPELAAAIAARSKAERRLRLAASFALGLVALVVLAYAFVGSWERNARDYQLSEGGLLALPPGDRALAQSLLSSAGLEVPASVDLTAGRVYRLDREFGALDAPALGLFLAAAALGALAMLVWTGTRPRGVPGLHVAVAVIEPVLAAASTLLVVCFATNLVGYATSANVVRDVEWAVTIERPPEAVEGALRSALIERELRVYAEVTGWILASPGGERLARVARLRACHPVPRERWQIDARGPIRLTPDLLVTVVGAPGGELTGVRIQAGALDEESPRREAWITWLDDLTRELVSAPDQR